MEVVARRYQKVRRLPLSGQARKRGADAPENDLSLVSWVRTANRWVSGNPMPLLKGPKSIVPPGTGAGSASSFSFKPLEGAKDKKWNLRPCIQREGLETQRVGCLELREGILTTSL